MQSTCPTVGRVVCMCLTVTSSPRRAHRTGRWTVQVHQVLLNQGEGSVVSPEVMRETSWAPKFQLVEWGQETVAGGPGVPLEDGDSDRGRLRLRPLPPCPLSQCEQHVQVWRLRVVRRKQAVLLGPAHCVESRVDPHRKEEKAQGGREFRTWPNPGH